MGASSSVIEELKRKKNEEVNNFIKKNLKIYPNFTHDTEGYESWSLERKMTTIILMIEAIKMVEEAEEEKKALNIKGGKRSRTNRHNMRKSKKSKK